MFFEFYEGLSGDYIVGGVDSFFSFMDGSLLLFFRVICGVGLGF